MYEIKHHIYWNIFEVGYRTTSGLWMPIRKFDSEAQARAFIEAKRESESV